MKLSEKQQDIFDEILQFFTDKDDPLFVFSGVAGSGKSTIISELMTALKGSKIAVLAYTGKASKVLRDKGIYNAQTIHSYLYDPVIDYAGNLNGFEKKPAEDFTDDYIIVDEASMLDEQIVLDLHATGRQILVVGDVNQLPPISSSDFNIMDSFNVRLEEIHRLAEDNPIIQISQHLLHEGTIPRIKNSEHVNYIPFSKVDAHLMECGEVYDTILCGTNRIRTKLNKTMRRKHGYRDRLPMVGEKVICLRNNNRDGNDHYNGDIFEIMNRWEYAHKWDLHTYQLKRDDGYTKSMLISDDIWFGDTTPNNYIKYRDHNGEEKKRFIDKFDLASVITVWKSQGSEYDNLLFVDEDVSYFVDRTKFRYTAITRSKNKITIAR